MKELVWVVVFFLILFVIGLLASCYSSTERNGVTMANYCLLGVSVIDDATRQSTFQLTTDPKPLKPAPQNRTVACVPEATP